MSDLELFELFENSIDTKLYTVKKNITIETIKKKKENLHVINSMLIDKIRPMLLKFQLCFFKVKKIRFCQKKNTNFQN